MSEVGSEDTLASNWSGDRTGADAPAAGELFAGRYRVAATSYEAGEVGGYELVLHSEEATAEFEAPIVRKVRVVQQADPDGTRRPVVAIRVRVGEIDETVEFTLADRSHLENPLILGRNFLQDLAVVDVGRQFVQPAFAPE